MVWDFTCPDTQKSGGFLRLAQGPESESMVWIYGHETLTKHMFLTAGWNGMTGIFRETQDDRYLRRSRFRESGKMKQTLYNEEEWFR
jgi:hypothetical protein